MEVQFRYGELRSLMGIMQQIVNTGKLPVVTAVETRKLIQTINNQFQIYQETTDSIVQELAEKDENGEPIHVYDEPEEGQEPQDLGLKISDMAELNKRFKELDAITFTANFTPIDLAYVPNIMLTVAELDIFENRLFKL